MKQKIFNDIYDRLNQFEEIKMRADSFPIFEQCFEKSKPHGPGHRLRNIKLSCKNTEKISFPVEDNLPSCLLNNEFLKEKYTSRFIQISPTKFEQKPEYAMKHHYSDKNPNRKGVSNSHFPLIPEYLTISENTKKALEMKKQNTNDFHHLIKKR